jgi:hypothetical protein
MRLSPIALSITGDGRSDLMALGSLSRRALLAAVAATALVGAFASGASGAARKATPCPTFRVVKPDPAAGYRAGIYDMSVTGAISCRGAVKLFVAYLDDPSGGLPSGWSHKRYIAGFSNGRAGFEVFQPERPRTHHRNGSVRKCPLEVGVLTNRVGVTEGLYTLLTFGRTTCGRAYRVFHSYVEGGGLVPPPYRLDSQIQAFYAGGSGFQYVLRKR